MDIGQLDDPESDKVLRKAGNDDLLLPQPDIQALDENSVAGYGERSGEKSRTGYFEEASPAL